MSNSPLVSSDTVNGAPEREDNLDKQTPSCHDSNDENPENIMHDITVEVNDRFPNVKEESHEDVIPHIADEIEHKPPTPNDENPSFVMPDALAAETADKLSIPNISVEKALAMASGPQELCDKIALQEKSRVVPSFETHYTDSSNLHVLEQGGCLFSFACCHELGEHEAEMMDSIVNLSAFEDETTENYVPHWDIYSNNNANNNEFTYLLVQCAYLLTSINVQQFLAAALSILSSFYYQQACQPTGTTVWNDYDKMQPDNFRITKPIIPYVLNFTTQFRVSAITDDKELCRLARLVKTRIDGGILLERTKRSVPPKQDATVKCKSCLLYTDMGSGVLLVTHITVVVQEGLPEIVEQIIHSLGSWGLGETCETAWKTRRYLQRILPEEAFLDANETETPPGQNESLDSEDRFYDVVGVDDDIFR